MGLTRRELIGYAVAGTTGMGITAAARQYQPEDPDTVGIQQYWQLGGVHARPATIEESAITFRASAGSSFDTDYDVRVLLRYGPKGGDRDDWKQLAEKEAPLSEGVYLEATATDLEPETTYQYQAEAFLTNYDDGPSRRVSQVREVTTGQPCSGPSTTCLRAETLAPETDGGEVTLRGRARGLDSYDEVTGRFFYRREDGSQQWTDYAPIEGDDAGKFSATLSLPEGTYTCYAEARGEGGELKNMYAEGGERTFAVGGATTETADGTETPGDPETDAETPDTTEAGESPTTDDETPTAEDGTTTDDAVSGSETTAAGLSNHLVIVGGGGGNTVSYEVTVSGRLEKDSSAGDAPIADRHVTVDAEDTINGSTATGTLGGGGDAYRFSGELVDVTADGSVRVYVNGTER